MRLNPANLEHEELCGIEAIRAGTFFRVFARIGYFLHGWEGRVPLFGSASLGSLQEELGLGDGAFAPEVWVVCGEQKPRAPTA
jgi:hypothetical protein